MATIKTQKGSFYMRNYYNNPRPQLTNMSFLFTCKCMIFYYKSRNVYYYFHLIFGKFSPSYLFEYRGGKANIKSSILKQSDTSSAQNFVTIELKYHILYNRG